MSHDPVVAAVGAERAALIRDKQRAALMSVIAGAFLTAFKLVVGLSTGSLGVLAEAAHSALDFGAAAITLFAVRESWQPPDAEHHYGHGKIENLSALAESALLVATSVWILVEAVKRFAGQGPEVEPSFWGFAVMGLSIAIDFGRSRDLGRVAKKSGSQALEADALHFSTDIASSGVVVAGLACVMAARHWHIAWLEYADPAAASIVALIVLLLSWDLGKRAADMLLDRAPRELVERARTALVGVERGVTPTFRLRQSGDQLFVDVLLTVARGLPMAHADEVAGDVRARLVDALGSLTEVTVQFAASQPELTSLRERVAVAVAMEGLQAHNVSVRIDAEGQKVDLHIEFPPTLSLGAAHARADQVEARLLRELPSLSRVDIHMEIAGAPEGERFEELTTAELQQLGARVAEVARAVLVGREIHDVEIKRREAGLFLSCHCVLPAAMPMAQAHAITDNLEARFRLSLPELSRISVHAEPEEAG